MTPQDLRQYLDRLVANRLPISTMIWGPPGIGKSSIVGQVAAANGLELIDVRLSQLAPTDLRGLPVAEGGRAKWYPPEFLPSDGAGILFLDELNMAPPAMQGIAQQLILDRKVGSYTLPENWFVWAAGNRKEDRASVFDMPAPLANRFLHLSVAPDLDSFKSYALASGLQEDVIAFLAFRPSLLHKPDPQAPAWPSPRSWEMASKLIGVELGISPVVGDGAEAEFLAYQKLCTALPDLQAILDGEGKRIPFPSEPSVRYAATIGLTARAQEAEAAQRAFHWLLDRAPAEWVSLFYTDLRELWRNRGRSHDLLLVFNNDPRIKEFMAKQFTEMLKK